MMNEFLSRIERHVRAMLKGYVPTATRSKIIHDPIWGSVRFYPWEVRLIDSPLFQRLRGISQVGLADSTYPAARHTRFEHSLGTAAIASRMMEKLREDAEASADRKGIVTEEQVRLVRLAALLHDVGHCPYSHLSEAIYGRMPAFSEAHRALCEAYGNQVCPKPHETFSYYIITSDALASFVFRRAEVPGVDSLEKAKALLLQAARMVIGAVNEGPDGTRYSYLTEVLNGNFDADKLDYTQRDSYTAGIALSYGVERFLLKLTLCRTERDGVPDYRLALAADGLSAVEELIFNRTMLYHYIYYHQKVLAAESQMRDALYALIRTGMISHPCDFLALTNPDLGTLFHSRRQPYAADGARRGRTMASLMDACSHRRLMKRALELTPESFEDPEKNAQAACEILRELKGKEEAEQVRILTERAENSPQFAAPYPAGISAYIDRLSRFTAEDYIAERKRLARRLEEAYRAAGKEVDFDAFDLAIAFQPPLKTRLSMMIADKSGRPVCADAAVRRMERWADTLNLSKWRGYFFVSPHVDRTLAGEVFRSYLKEWIENGSAEDAKNFFNGV